MPPLTHTQMAEWEPVPGPLQSSFCCLNESPQTPELDSIGELGGEHWGWAVITTKPDTYLVLPLRDGE